MGECGDRMSQDPVENGFEGHSQTGSCWTCAPMQMNALKISAEDTRQGKQQAYGHKLSRNVDFI